jgi:hypothetical protein
MKKLVLIFFPSHSYLFTRDSPSMLQRASVLCGEHGSWTWTLMRRKNVGQTLGGYNKTIYLGLGLTARVT